MLGHRYVMAVIIVVGLLAAPSFAAAVRIIGEEFAEVDIASGRFVFDGPVTVTDDTVTIRGTRLIYLSEQELLQFVGEVTIEQDDTSVAGRDLTYDAATGEWTLDKPLMSTLPSGAVSPVYLSGARVNACPTLTVIDEAALTTCDPNQPGYYLASKRIEIHPGDRLVLYGVRFVESGLTLFYWPRITFSLKSRDWAESLSLPKLGYSSEEGWFVKTSFGYHGPGNQRGRFLVDYMQLLGWGFGVDHVLRTDAAGSESIYLYVQPNMKTEHTDLTLGLYGERALPGDLKLSGGSTFSTEYDDGENLWRHHELSLSQQRSNGSSELRYSDKRVTGAQTGYETYAVLSHVQRSADGWHLRLSADVDKQDMPDLPRRNLVGYRAELGRETANWSFDLTAEDLFNPELAKDEPTEEITWNRAQALPELKARIKRLHVFGREIPLSADFAWGRLTEDRPVFPTPVRVSTERMHVAAQTEFPQVDLGSWGRWQWNGFLARRIYGTGEKQWVAGARSTYRLPVSERLTLNADYRYEQSFGDLSPFRFDRVVDEEELRAAVQYNTANAGWRLSGGYDLFNKEPIDVIGSLRWQLKSGLNMQMQSAYSIADSSWVYTVATLQYIPSDSFSVQLGARYNMETKYAERVDAAFHWDLKGWRVSYAAIYDGIENEFDLGDFTITRDLGCRVIDLRFDQTRKEVWLEYRIPAFPAAAVKVGATEQHLMFDAKGWEEVLAIE
ncbi:MAG: hypothetical protein GX162_04420 [Firmicutes bacterium]|jgi:hypothetical protein|nr:hypothetical protein [Bacillota bacterium]